MPIAGNEPDGRRKRRLTELENRLSLFSSSYSFLLLCIYIYIFFSNDSFLCEYRWEKTADSSPINGAAATSFLFDFIFIFFSCFFWFGFLVCPFTSALPCRFRWFFVLVWLAVAFSASSGFQQQQQKKSQSIEPDLIDSSAGHWWSWPSISFPAKSIDKNLEQRDEDDAVHRWNIHWKAKERTRWRALDDDSRVIDRGPPFPTNLINKSTGNRRPTTRHLTMQRRTLEKIQRKALPKRFVLGKGHEMSETKKKNNNNQKCIQWNPLKSFQVDEALGGGRGNPSYSPRQEHESALGNALSLSLGRSEAVDVADRIRSRFFYLGE